MKKVKAYQCEFCNKTSMHESTIRGHEKRCFDNPERRACQTCANNDICPEKAADCAEWKLHPDFIEKNEPNVSQLSLIPNSIFGKCDPKEIVIIAFLASKKSGWEFNTLDIAKVLQSSVLEANEIIKSIQKKGYLEIEKTKDSLNYTLRLI